MEKILLDFDLALLFLNFFRDVYFPLFSQGGNPKLGNILFFNILLGGKEIGRGGGKIFN